MKARTCKYCGQTILGDTRNHQRDCSARIQGEAARQRRRYKMFKRLHRLHRPKK